MTVTNIDSLEYDQHYRGIDRNLLIQSFQTFKHLTILPVFRLAKRDASFLDVGCAKGNFLRLLQAKGYRDVFGLDLEQRLYPELESKVTFFKRSICERGLNLGRKFHNIQVSCMLHHLPAEELEIVAENLVRHLEPGGHLFIYEPNITSVIGAVFYRYFLRLFPRLYAYNVMEEEDQIRFCQAWPAFVASLQSKGVTKLKTSELFFYKAFVGVKKS